MIRDSVLAEHQILGCLSFFGWEVYYWRMVANNTYSWARKKNSILALQCHWMICGRGNHRNLYYPFFSTYSLAEVILILYILLCRPFSNFISEHDPPSITIAFLADEIIMWSSSEKISPAFHYNALCVSAAATSFLDPLCFGWVPYFIVTVYCGRPFCSLLIDLFLGRKSYFSRWFWSYIGGSV